MTILTARPALPARPAGWLGGVALLLLALSAPAHAATTSTWQVTLAPASPDPGSRRIDAVRVSIRVPEPDRAAKAPLLRMPLVINNVQTSATTLRDLHARDADGPLVLHHRDDTTGKTTYRDWSAERPVHGPVTVSYRVPVTNQPNPLGAAPPFELRSSDRAFSGLLGSFVMLPVAGRHRLQLHWDFSAMHAGALGISTLGTGERTTPTALPTDKLQSIFLMGGHPGHEPAQPADDGFFSAWQGQPPFDARNLMQWTHRLYRYYLKFFHRRASTYRVFLRPNPVNPGGGVEVQHSFVGTFGPHTSVKDFKLTLAHEMVHTFVGALGTDTPLADSWFSEGLAVYYQRLLPWRAGMITGKEYLADLNQTAARYYTDILNTTPNKQIASRFWQDTRVRVLPYDRGALYFAQLNAEIRRASHGKRSLDDLVLAFLQRQTKGLPLDRQAWVDAVVGEIGPRGKQQFEDMLHGKPIALASDAFGPCFRRTSVPMRRYQLGFTPDVLVEPKRIIRGLIPGSSAARAGLRNGDRILEPVPQDAIQADQHATLTLVIRRDGKTLHITYLPRGEKVPAYQWVDSGAAGCSSGSSTTMPSKPYRP